MPTLKNVSPLGDLDIPALGRTVKAGEEFDAPAALAASLLEQEVNFVPAEAKKPKAD